MEPNIGRRRFLVLLGTAAGSWPTPLHSQQVGAPRTIGFVMGLADDAEAKARVEAFESGLRRYGWTPGRDLRIEYRYSAGDTERMRGHARELVALQPDLIVGHSTPVVTQLTQANRHIPIVFVVVADPVGSGFAKSIPNPGGNATGFTNLDVTIPGKLLTLLKQVAPQMRHVGLMFNPATIVRGESLRHYLRQFQTAAASFSVGAKVAQVHSPQDIEATMARLGKDPGCGLIVMPDNFTAVHRKRIVALASEWRIPTIYPYRYFVEAGGLLSYGVDVVDLFRRAANYVDRILRGASPANLPIQAPTKFELVINLKAADKLGLAIPKTLLTGAKELIR